MLFRSPNNKVVVTAPLQGVDVEPDYVTYVYGIDNAYGLSVTDIGKISQNCHTILMVSTGPSWPTFNIFNQESVKLRIILLDSERVNLSPNTIHCDSIRGAEFALKKFWLL